MKSNQYMEMALENAQAASAQGEVPVGAVIVDAQGSVLAQAGNETRLRNDPTGHAEIVAIRAACAVLGQDRLTGAVLYVTLEPCAMCAGAIANARIARVVFGAYDPKSGGTDHGARVFDHPQCHHKPEVVGGILEDRCAAILKDFFEASRD